MPNGSLSEDEFRESERFFSSVADCITRFGEKHNLLLDKYYHAFPSWDLCFAHPAGGQAKIEISRVGDRTISVIGMWWLDVYAEFTRYIRDTQKRHCLPSPDALLPLLEASFREVLAWHAGGWTRVAGGMENPWAEHTEEEFERMRPQWPFPRP
jgi:hypothetical protein